MPEAFFEAYDHFYGWSLFVTDGTASGTRRVRHFNTQTGYINQIAALRQGELILIAPDGANPTPLNDIYGTDGKLIGHSRVSGQINFVFGGMLYYSNAQVSKIFVTDGSNAGTHLLFNLDTKGYGTAFGISGVHYFDMGGQPYLYYTKNMQNSTSFGEVYKLSASGATFAFHFSTKGGVDSAFASLGKYILFENRTAKNGEELWVSDGTTAGTHLLKDIFPGPNSSIDYQSGKAQSPNSYGPWTQSIFVAGTEAVFAADDGRHGFELWGTDGTTSGTHLLKDITPGSGVSVITTISFKEEHTIGKNVLFTEQGLDDNGSYDLDRFWLTDGTSSGTRQVDMQVDHKAIASDTGSTYLAGSKLYFSGFEESDGAMHGLYAYNFATKHTALVKLGVEYAEDFQKFGTGFLFSNNDIQGTGDLWISSGTAAGTHEVKNINAAGSEVSRIAVLASNQFSG